MVKMEGPYLESGESIILTTDRIRVNSVQYDVLLTSRNLILVDTGHTRFQPLMYPLLSILSVKGGKTANGELVISLFFHETRGKDDPGPMVLVFSQQPGEQRQAERDDWIQKLIKFIVSVRQETIKKSCPGADQKGGIQPSVRRTVAPEMQLPYRTAPDAPSAHIDMIIIPDEPEAPAFPEETEPEVIPANPEEEEIPVDSYQVTESPAPLTDSEEIPVDSYQVTESQAPLKDSEEIPVDSVQVSESTYAITSPVVPDTSAFADTQKENEELITTHEASPMEESQISAQKDTGYSDLPPPPEQIVTSSLQCSPTEESEPSYAEPSQSGNVQESFPQPDVATTPPQPTPPQSQGTGSRRRVFIAFTAIIVIILILAGAGVYYSAYRAPPFTVEPVPSPTPTITLTIDPTLQQTPVPAPVIIPANGVWVRVDYFGDYYGWLGLPGSLRGINNTGVQLYKMPESAGIIQVNVYTQDYSGKPLTVTVYRDGKIINNRTVSVPKGYIELLLDTKTGNPPGLSPVVTQSDNQTGTNAGRIVYF